MNISANLVIDHLGGTSAVARMIEAPTSTVHSWRRIGIPASRMAHLRLAASAAGRELPEDLGDLSHSAADAAAQQAPSTGQCAELSGSQAIRGAA
ncbi:carph-isopro domain-containing protein [Novosphingobium silvae]|uniref:carph-isopro domain-containing protein n=1 Tax=Novosphingobium silvae TaxID=2692619 RepID=UPI003B029781